MGNTNSVQAEPELSYDKMVSIHKLTYSELLEKVAEDIDKAYAIMLTITNPPSAIYLKSPHASEFLFRNIVPDNNQSILFYKFDDLFPIINKYNRPYIVDGPIDRANPACRYAFCIRFIQMPSGVLNNTG